MKNHVRGQGPVLKHSQCDRSAITDSSTCFVTESEGLNLGININIFLLFTRRKTNDKKKNNITGSFYYHLAKIGG
jgi:hypothetical protein